MKIFRNISISLFAVSMLSAACGDELVEPGPGSVGGKADVVSAPELVVVANNTVCITAPCPTLTVIDTMGSVSRIADVVFPDGQEDQIEHVFDAGLRVEGQIVIGGWQPGGPGDVLYVDAVNEPVGHASPFLNGVVCFTAPCPSWTVLHTGGEHTQVAGVDLSALDITDESAGRLREEMSAGRLLIGGYVRPGSWNVDESGDTYVVTRMTSVINGDHLVRVANIMCPTTPCPSYEVVGGNVNTMLHSINFDALELTDANLYKVFKTLESDGMELRGFINEITRESILGGMETIMVLHVTRILSGL